MNADNRFDDDLCQRAWDARLRAHCPYSNFAVGAALEDETGAVWDGANVENAAYPLGMCAERVALHAAITHGARNIRRVIVATDTERPTAPCGGCRQVLMELAPEAEVWLVSRADVVKTNVRALLPFAFAADNLLAARE